MKFLHAEDRVEVALHKSKTSGRREKRQVVMEFFMKLDAKRISSISTFIAEAWKAMRKAGSGVCLTELDRGIDSQNILFFALPSGEVELEMEATDLTDLRLEKSAAGEIFLFFKIAQPMTKTLWNWLFHSEQAEVLYAEFEECQQELLKEEGKPQTARVQ